MERLTLVLIALFVLLFIGQLYVREYFITSDMEKSTITMTLSELLYTIGVGTQQMQQQGQQQRGGYDMRNGDERHDNHHDHDELQTYLTMKEEMLHGVKSGLNKFNKFNKFNNSNKLPCNLRQPSVTPTSNCGPEPINTYVSPSCIQGSAYMESVPLVSSSSCDSC